MDRRSFIMDAVALVAGALPGGGRASLASTPTAEDAGTAATVLVDTSLGQSVAFASDAVSAGASVAAVGGDVGALWYTRLAGTRGRIAGVLRPSDVFVLTRLARHAGYTVLVRPVHARTMEIAIASR